MQLQQIQDTIELEDSYAASARYIDCFRGLLHSTKNPWLHSDRGQSGVNLRRTIVATMVFVLQQGAGMFLLNECQHKDAEYLKGVVFVLGFSTYFFELAGFANTNAFNLGIGVTGIGVSVWLLFALR